MTIWRYNLCLFSAYTCFYILNLLSSVFALFCFSQHLYRMLMDFLCVSIYVPYNAGAYFVSKFICSAAKFLIFGGQNC